MRFLRPLQVALLVLGAGLLVSLYVIDLNAPQKTSGGELTFEDRRSYLSSKDGERRLEALWGTQIRELGGEEAYSLLKRAYASTSQADGHIEAHLFGSALYKTLGTEGVTVCDGDLDLGCYHEFIGQAIVHEGLGVIQHIDHVCNALPYVDFLGCQHGIGHGLVGYFGYEGDELIEALKICNTLQRPDNTNGCYSGALMEYNVRTMLYMDRVPPRELVNDNYFEPCDQIPAYAQESCYFWHHEWWKIVLQDDGLETYGFMGDLCDQVEEPNRSTCFKGLGQSTSKTNTDPTTAIALCKTATTGSSAHAALQCLTTAAAGFSAHKQLFLDSAAMFCSELADEASSYSICNN